MGKPKKATSDRTVTNTDSIALPTTPTPTKIVNITDKDPSVKTWGEFFKMVGVEALTSTEAQKKENMNIRTKQIELGLQAARDLDLGEWTTKRAGRDFLKVGD